MNSCRVLEYDFSIHILKNQGSWYRNGPAVEGEEPRQAVGMEVLELQRVRGCS